MSFDKFPVEIMYIGIGALILWRVYSRVRRMVGRQRLSRIRPWFTVILFPLLLLALLVAGIAHPMNDLGLLAGIAIGAVLGIIGHKLTRFERTPQGLFYTPNAHLGIALSLLMIGRIAYRAVPLLLAGQSIDILHPDFARSPITLVIFGTLASYYVTYAIGLLRWRFAPARSTIAASDSVTVEAADRA